jgi:hypothetical protein
LLALGPALGALGEVLVLGAVLLIVCNIMNHRGTETQRRGATTKDTKNTKEEKVRTEGGPVFSFPG